MGNKWDWKNTIIDTNSWNQDKSLQKIGRNQIEHYHYKFPITGFQKSIIERFQGKLFDTFE